MTIVGEGVGPGFNQIDDDPSSAYFRAQNVNSEARRSYFDAFSRLNTDLVTNIHGPAALTLPEQYLGELGDAEADYLATIRSYQSRSMNGLATIMAIESVALRSVLSEEQGLIPKSQILASFKGARTPELVSELDHEHASLMTMIVSEGYERDLDLDVLMQEAFTAEPLKQEEIVGQLDEAAADIDAARELIIAIQISPQLEYLRETAALKFIR